MNIFKCLLIAGIIIAILGIKTLLFAESFEEAVRVKESSKNEKAINNTLTMTRDENSSLEKKLQNSIADIEGDLQRSDPEVSVRALRNIGHANDSKATSVLIKLLDSSKHPYYRAWSAEILGRIKDRKSIPILEKSLQDPSHQVKLAAAVSLVSLKKYQTAFPILEEIALRKGVNLWEVFLLPIKRKRNLEIIEHYKSGMVSKAVRVLGKINDQKALGVIDKCLDDPNDLVRLNAAGALIKISNNGRAIQTLIKIIDAEEITFSVKEAAIKTLAQGNEAGMLVLKKYSQQYNDPLISNLAQKVLAENAVTW